MQLKKTYFIKYQNVFKIKNIFTKQYAGPIEWVSIRYKTFIIQRRKNTKLVDLLS